MRAVALHTSDGQALAADINEADAVRGVAVVCHPHPLYGGNRFNPVVEALWTAFPAAGLTTIRFDFRTAHDHGIAERLDAIAAIDEVATGALPVVLVGYSFGALVALTTRDARITAVIAVAPPLGPDAAAPGVPVLVVSPEHDQHCPFERAAEITRGWADAACAPVVGADHFLAGHTLEVAQLAVDWSSTQIE